MVELKDRQQQETEGRLQLPSRVMVMEGMFTSLKVHTLKVHIRETYYIIKKGQTQVVHGFCPSFY